MILGELASPRQRMRGPGTSEVVHVELHTANLPHARSFYQQLLGWSAVLTIPIDRLTKGNVAGRPWRSCASM